MFRILKLPPSSCSKWQNVCPSICSIRSPSAVPPLTNFVHVLLLICVLSFCNFIFNDIIILAFFHHPSLIQVPNHLKICLINLTFSPSSILFLIDDDEARRVSKTLRDHSCRVSKTLRDHSYRVSKTLRDHSCRVSNTLRDLSCRVSNTLSDHSSCIWQHSRMSGLPLPYFL